MPDDFFDPGAEPQVASLIQYGAELPPGTARMTPGQGAPISRVQMDAKQATPITKELNWDDVVEMERRLDEEHEWLQQAGFATRKWYLEDVDPGTIKDVLAMRWNRQTAKAIYDTTVQQWKPYREMYRIAGEYARGERVDPSYVQGLKPRDRELFYAFMSEQASPEQRSGLGKMGENFLRRAEDMYNAMEVNMAKLYGWELVVPEPTKEGPGWLTVRKTQDPKALEVEAAVGEAADIRRRIKALRERGDPVESESLLGQGMIDVAGMAPSVVIGGALASQTGGLGGVAFWTSQIAPDLETEMVEMGVPREEAVGWSLLAAVPSAAVEALQIKQAANIAGAKEAVKRGMVGFLAGYAKQFGKNWAKELGEEGIQFLIEEGAKQAAVAASKENPDIDWQDIIDRGLEEMRRAGVSLFLMTAAGHAPGGLQGLRISNAKQNMYNAATVVAERSQDKKMQQYANTLLTMLDSETPIDKKSKSLAERVLEEADKIRTKDAIAVIGKERAKEIEAKAKKQGEREGAKQAKKAPLPKKAVAEPQKPVERPAPKPEPKVPEPKKAAPAQPEPQREAPAKPAEPVAPVPVKPEPAPRTERVPPKVAPAPAPAPEEAGAKLSPYAIKKRVRARKVESGSGIRQVASETDKALMKGRLQRHEAEAVYTDLGLRAVELEKRKGDKVNLSSLKDQLRQRIRLLRGEQTAAQTQAPAVEINPGDLVTVRVKEGTFTGTYRGKNNILTDAGQSVNFQPNQVIRRVAKTATMPWLDATMQQREQKKAVPKPAQFKEVPGPRMGEEVLQKRPAPKPATEHTRADALSELGLDDMSRGEMEEVAKDRGIAVANLTDEQLQDEIIRDAESGGEIAPVVEGVQPEVEPKRAPVPAYKQPPPQVRLGEAEATGLTQNEVRSLRDDISTELTQIEGRHGAKDALRKHLAGKGASPQTIVRQTAESGDYDAGARRLKEVRKAINSMGQKAKWLRDFKRDYRAALDLAISEYTALSRGAIPETIQGRRQRLQEASAQAAEREAKFDELRRRSPEMDAGLAAMEATEQKSDVGFVRGEEGGAQIPIETRKNAEAQMRVAERDAQAIEAPPEQLVADAILEVDDPAWREGALEAVEREKGEAFANRVRELVAAKSTPADDIASAVNYDSGAVDEYLERESFDPDDRTTSIHSGVGPSALRPVLDGVSRMWDQVIRGHKLWKARSQVFESMRRAFNSQAYNQEMARRLINEQFLGENQKLSERDVRTISEWRDRDVGVEALPEHLREVGQKTNEFYEVIDTTWRQMGMGTWPTSAIKRAEARAEALREKLVEAREGTRRHADILEEIEALEKEAQYLATLRYQHHVVLGKKQVTPEVLIALDKAAGSGVLREKLKTTPEMLLGRKYPTLQSLEDAGFRVEWDFRIAMAEAYAYTHTKMMVHEFHENIIKQDPTLALPAKEAPAHWVELPGIEPYNRTRYKSGTHTRKVIGPDGKVRTEERPNYLFSGKKWKVHPMFADAVRDFTEGVGHITTFGKAYDALNSMMKQMRFYNPLIMFVNNIQQGFAGAGLKWALNLKDAFRSVVTKDDDYMAMLYGDLFSMPADLKFDDFRDLMRADIDAHLGEATFLRRWLHRMGIEKKSDYWKLLPVHPDSAPYRTARQITWWMDRVARVATVKAMVNRRMKQHKKAKRRGRTDLPFNRARAMAEAIIEAREFHGDYNLLRRQPGKWLRRLFLTPAYKTAMWYRLFPKVIADAAKGTYELASGKEIRHDVMPLARVLMGISATSAAMAIAGYSWEDTYRWVKKKDDEEEGQEHVIQMFGPFSEPFKVYGRFTSAYEEGKSPVERLGKGINRVLYNNLAALPKAMSSVFVRNRDWQGNTIITPGAPFEQQMRELLWFSAKEAVPLSQQIETWGDAEQGTFDKLAGLTAVTMYTRDTNKRQWFKNKLVEKQKDVRAWAKDMAQGDPGLSKQYNVQAAKRYAAYVVSLSSALKQYEDRLETARKGGVTLRLLNQFDRMAWGHTKLEAKTPALLPLKKLAELKQLRNTSPRMRPGETREDYIERMMRKVFAATFLRETVDE